MTDFIVTTSWDDGHPLDLKLAEILDQYNLTGSFYVAPSNSERQCIYSTELREIAEKFEIGAHTLTHSVLNELDDITLNYEIRAGKEYLETIIGKAVTTFSYPKGIFNQKVKQAVIDAGFIGARTTERFCLGRPEDLFMIPTTMIALQHPIYIQLGHVIRRKNWQGLVDFLQIGVNKSWVDIACSFFEKFLQRGGIYHLWGHSWEIEEHNLWDDLRQVFKIISHHKNVTYLTNSELITKLIQK